MKKRNRLEIIKDILFILNNNPNGIKFTPLLRKTNLSSARFLDYYKEILSKNFIIEKNYLKERKVFITEKGLRFLEKYQTIMNFIDEFEL